MGHKVRDKGCSQDDCTATYKDHEWGHKKAQREGWFLQLNGDSWCPDHNPPWVKEWRNKKRRERYANKKLDAGDLQDLSEFVVQAGGKVTVFFYHNVPDSKCTYNKYLDDPSLDVLLMDAFDHLKECDK